FAVRVPPFGGQAGKALDLCGIEGRVSGCRFIGAVFGCGHGGLRLKLVASRAGGLSSAARSRSSFRLTFRQLPGNPRAANKPGLNPDIKARPVLFWAVVSVQQGAGSPFRMATVVMKFGGTSVANVERI